MKESDIMINARFTEHMKEILKSLKNKTFKSYECHKTGKNSAYGKCRLNMGTFSIDLSNSIHELPFFGAFPTEDVPFFTCEYVDKEISFVPCERNATAHVYMIDERIKSVEIINDEIDINHGEYEISIDQALVIRTKDNVYSFSKGWMFSELIYIYSDRFNYKVYDLNKVKDDWSGNGKDIISVKRTTIIL